MKTTLDPDLTDHQDTAPQSTGADQPRAPLLVRRDIQKLSRNGSSVNVNILRPYLRHLGWLAGQTVIVELYDNDAILLRKPRQEDLGPTIGKARRLDLLIPVRA